MKWRKQFRKFSRGRQEAEAKPGNAIFEQFLHQKVKGNKARTAGSAADRQRTRRRANVLKRAITRRFRFRPKSKIPVLLLAFRQRQSRLIDALVKPSERRWLKPLVRARQGASLEIQVKHFCFLDRPDETWETIGKMARAEAGAWNIRVHFDDEQCLDIAPYLLTAMLWKDLAPVFSGGRMTTELQSVIEAVQLRRQLGMGRFRLDLWDRYNVHAFPLHQRRAANSSTSMTRHLDPQTRERVGDNLVSSINSWLAHPELEMELTPIGRGNIKNIVGEMLDNAERHSMPDTMDGDWTIAGFMARREPGEDQEEYFYCSIAFVSIGASISDSLSTCAPGVAKVLNRYVDMHKAACDVEVLRTIMSIQDGITRVPTAYEEGRGGTGFQEVIDLVNDLGSPHPPTCEPKVTILSGHACLKLHGPYAQGVRKGGDPFAPREIWFNGANDSAAPPDPQYAFRLRHAFPGTLVTLSFVFKPERSAGDEK